MFEKTESANLTNANFLAIKLQVSKESKLQNIANLENSRGPQKLVMLATLWAALLYGMDLRSLFSFQRNSLRLSSAEVHIDTTRQVLYHQHL